MENNSSLTMKFIDQELNEGRKPDIFKFQTICINT
jgi:hypothetical protein